MYKKWDIIMTQPASRPSTQKASAATRHPLFSGKQQHDPGICAGYDTEDFWFWSHPPHFDPPYCPYSFLSISLPCFAP
jgi:hypothetical protein